MEFNAKDVTINGYELKCTCEGCPEQYDVFKDGVQLAYLRLRHGTFYGSVPDAYGAYLFEVAPKGDGCFEYDERDMFLSEAISILDEYLNGNDCLRDYVSMRLKHNWRIYL